jgi:hypothetical protein
MDEQQLIEFFNNASASERADFNNNSEFTLYDTDGDDSSDGVLAATAFSELSDEARANVILNISLGVKHPCD